MIFGLTTRFGYVPIRTTRTRCEWMPLDASDEQQLLKATARDRCILTFNIGDFMRLAQRYPALNWG